MSSALSSSCPFPYRGPPELQAAVVAALQQVVDPEVALSVVDLGLVYGVEIEPGQARVTMTMTSAACPVGDVIAEDVEMELRRVLPAGTAAAVTLVWEPAWTPEKMSERARRFME
ncbi:MAG: metal-sulfur cluster assembly factor [Rubrivivax sp.]